jgi:hypothetical protein
MVSLFLLLLSIPSLIAVESPTPYDPSDPNFFA